MTAYLKTILLFLLPAIAFSQQDMRVISDSSFSKGWVRLTEHWRYQKGDNPEWSKPTFNDSQWPSFNGFNLNMAGGNKAVADRGEIAWFRTYLKTGSPLQKSVVLTVAYMGNSQVYLDGKLIRGPDRFIAQPGEINLGDTFRGRVVLPLKPNTRHVLAVRYINGKPKFPLFPVFDGFCGILLNSLENTQSRDLEKNGLIMLQERFRLNYYIALGMGVLIFIIFLSFYMFFPRENINGYFTLANLFLVLFIAIILASFKTIQSDRLLSIPLVYGFFGVLFQILLFYCIYRVLKAPLDLWFRTVNFFGGLCIAGFFLVEGDQIASFFALIVYIAIIRISSRSLKTNRVAGLLFLSASALSLLYWIVFFLNTIEVLKGVFIQYSPLVIMLNPVVLAIYLGYNFGKRSELLRLNLERIQILSSEKEALLSQQNKTLEQQVAKRTRELQNSLEELKSTQAQLIQSEKMASLGELTAGIAHEIQNPLNFVNNFSEVSRELLEEMIDELKNGDTEEVDAIAQDVIQNLEKILHHGKRADSIVKGMLQHSNSGEGKKEPTDINALADEYLRLAFHGLRAKDKSFNAIMETDFDTSLEKMNLVPQDIGRVLLNLLTNAFHAVSERKQQEGQEYEPTVWVKTQKAGRAVEILVCDNGGGIPEAIRGKVFQPFFTTKPTGEGTGLGLSMSFDIISKGHGGEILVESVEGKGSEFTIKLPVTGNP